MSAATTTPAAASSTTASKFRGPLKVEYCPSCTMPPEYCMYGPCWDQCKVHLEKKHPDILADALARMKISAAGTSAAAATESKVDDESKESESTPAAASSSSSKASKKKSKADDDDEEDDEDDDDDDDEDEEDEEDDKKQKKKPAVKFAAPASGDADDEFLAAAAPVKAKKAASSGPGIYISMANRSKKKFITTIKGFESFNIVLKDVTKLISKKFACSASSIKAADGSTEIAVSGDIVQDLPFWIVEEFPQIDKKLIWTVDKAGKKMKAF